MKYNRKAILSMLFLTFFTALMAQAPLRSKHFNLESGLAIQGYDPVCYFIENKAQKGSQSYSYTTEGVTYHFVSLANKNKFTADIKKYEPQYGGWCAYAMGNSGEKVEIDPETFKIKDGKLYLFYNAYFTNTLTKWNKDENNLKTKADNNWKSIFK
jgi:YHS domain-containing protein